jgi:hypothetical protein
VYYVLGQEKARQWRRFERARRRTSPDQYCLDLVAERVRAQVDRQEFAVESWRLRVAHPVQVVTGVDVGELRISRCVVVSI